MLNRLIPAWKTKGEFADVFIGRISQVKVDPDSNSRTEGEITFNFIKGNEKQVTKAKVILNAQQYANACEAHKNGSTISIAKKRFRLAWGTKFSLLSYMYSSSLAAFRCSSCCQYYLLRNISLHSLPA